MSPGPWGKPAGDSVTYYPAGGLAGRMLIRFAGWGRLAASGHEHRQGQPGKFFVLEKSTTSGNTASVCRDRRFNEAEWRQCLEKISGLLPQADYLVASGRLPPGVPPDFYGRLAGFGREHNTRLVVDTSGEALPLAVAEGVFLIKPNLREFAELMGCESVDGLEEERLAGRSTCFPPAGARPWWFPWEPQGFWRLPPRAPNGCGRPWLP